jgi:hypothetical protein
MKPDGEEWVKLVLSCHETRFGSCRFSSAASRRRAAKLYGRRCSARSWSRVKHSPQLSPHSTSLPDLASACSDTSREDEIWPSSPPSTFGRQHDHRGAASNHSADSRRIETDPHRGPLPVLVRCFFPHSSAGRPGLAVLKFDWDSRSAASRS